MYAAVDLGSNSFRLHVGQHEGDAIRVIKSLREPIRLAAGLDAQGALTPAAMQAALDCLADFRQALSAYQLDAVRAVATSAMRTATNGATFLPACEQALGHPIEIISGEEEGRLIYMGVANALPNASERRLVIDIGGGSTELILGSGPDIDKVESFSIGTVKQSLSFFVGGHVTPASFDAAVLSARSHFEDAAPSYQAGKWKAAYGSSGTIRAIAEVISKNKLGDGRLTLANLHLLRQRFIAFGQVDKVELAGLRPDRASTIVGGIAILIALLAELGIEQLHAVEAGLRMGVMWDLYFRSTRRDRREQAVQALADTFRADLARGRRVASDALALYAQLRPNGEGPVKLLGWCALLHELGMVLSHTGYHKHTAYMIEHADLPGFTAREQKTMSKLAQAQKGNLRKVSELLQDPDLARAVLALRLAILFMHARIDGDLAQVKLRMKARIELEIRRSWLSEHPTIAYWIEREQEWWDEVNVDFSLKTVA